MKRKYLLGVLSLCLLAISVLTTTAQAVDVPTLNPGQQVQANRGNGWEPAMFLVREGHKCQVRFADGAEPWLTFSQIDGGAGSTPSVPAPLRRRR